MYPKPRRVRNNFVLLLHARRFKVSGFTLRRFPRCPRMLVAAPSPGLIPHASPRVPNLSERGPMAASTSLVPRRRSPQTNAWQPGLSAPLTERYGWLEVSTNRCAFRQSTERRSCNECRIDRHTRTSAAWTATIALHTNPWQTERRKSALGRVINRWAARILGVGPARLPTDAEQEGWQWRRSQARPLFGRLA